MELNLDDVFQGASVPAWLRSFEKDPDSALSDLLVGRAMLGELDADEPSSVLIDWLTGLRGHFSTAVDQSLATWINQSWGEWQLPQARGSAALTAIAWCQACDVIAAVDSLEKSAVAIRQLVLQDREFLDGLRQGRSRDPEGRAWFALARHQRDRALINEWWRLCSLPPNEPWYRGGYGIHGLRGLPPASETDSGGFRTEVADGLKILGVQLSARSELGNPDEATAKNEFVRVARLAMAAFPYPKLWREFWLDVVPSQKEQQIPEDWIRKLDPKTGSNR